MTNTTNTTNIGIDVSKARLDVAVRPSGEAFSVANDESGRTQLRKRLAKLKPERIVLEPSGGYEALVVHALAAAKLPVVVVNARCVRQFAQAAGRLAKTDTIDAQVLAHFAEAMKPEIRAIPDEAARELGALVSRRRQLVDMRAAEIKRRQMSPPLVHPSIDLVIEFLTKQIDDAENNLLRVVRETPAWRAAEELYRSVPGVGPVLSNTVTALVPEIGKLNRKQIASLIGVAPMNNDSGARQGKRRAWGGRAPVRAVLYMATIAAIRFNSTLRSLHDRLIAKGKPAKVAIVACMRKLLTILNAIARDGRPWNPQLEGAP